MTAPLKLVDKDEYPDQISMARFLAATIVLTDFDQLSVRANDEHGDAILKKLDREELSKRAEDKEILAVLSSAQRALRRIEVRHKR